jgi:DNA-binding CsgD family transcriptional regulator
VDDAAVPIVPRRLNLVGRDAERARLESFSASLREGAHALVLRGEAGIGKTALWRDGVDQCRQAGFRVLLTRPTEEEMPLAAGGLVDLLEHVDVDVAALRAEDDPFTRGRSVLDALRGLARHGPVVVAIDDIQWLDSVSARALRYALRRLDLEPVGLLATARPVTAGEEILMPASALPPGRCDVLDIGPLSLGALRRLLGGIVDAISRPALVRIHAISGGNPLYAIELARAGRGSTDFALPDSLQAVLARKLDAAPAELNPLLEAVAALGPTSVGELRETLADCAVDAQLAAGREHGLLVVEEDLTVRFDHPLIGSAVYARIDPLAKRALHAQLAGRAVEPDLRARHLALSTDSPDPAVAAQLEEAAKRASGRGAPDVAAEFAGHSRRLTPPGDHEAGRRRALAQIEHLAAAGEVRRALALADELVASLEPGAARVEALVQRADLEDDDSATAEKLLLGALEEARDDERLRARVLHRLARLRRLRIGDLRGAIACAREALTLAESVGDPRLEANAAAYLAHLEALAGTLRPDLMRRAVELEEEIGSLPLSVGPRSLLAKHHLWAGDLGSARNLLERVHAGSVRSGNEMRRPQHFYDLTLVECAAGNLAAAEDVVREGTEAALDAENTNAERELLYPLALVQALSGQSEAARATVTRLCDEATRHGIRPLLVRAGSVLGLLALSEGDTTAAARELTDAARLLDEMGFAHPGAFPVLPDAVEALAGNGDAAGAAELLDFLERQATAVASSYARAAARRASGMALLATGDAEAAAPALADAATAYAGLGFNLDGARASLGCGRALLRGGRRVLAAETLADARRRFAAMGARLWEARAAEELERAAPGRAAGELTAAERRVARLVAEGMKNREIGQALFMSVATVEAHLTRIYRKLGIRSRSELARLVTDRSVEVSDDATTDLDARRRA